MFDFMRSCVNNYLLLLLSSKFTVFLAFCSLLFSSFSRTINSSGGFVFEN